MEKKWIEEGRTVIVASLGRTFVGKLQKLEDEKLVVLSDALEVIIQPTGSGMGNGMVERVSIGIGMGSPVIPIGKNPAKVIVITSPFVVLEAPEELVSMYISASTGIQIPVPVKVKMANNPNN